MKTIVSLNPKPTHQHPTRPVRSIWRTRKPGWKSTTSCRSRRHPDPGKWFPPGDRGNPSPRSWLAMAPRSRPCRYLVRWNCPRKSADRQRLSSSVDWRETICCTLWGRKFPGKLCSAPLPVVSLQVKREFIVYLKHWTHLPNPNWPNPLAIAVEKLNVFEVHKQAGRMKDEKRTVFSSLSSAISW